MLIIWKFPKSIAGRTKRACGPRVWDPLVYRMRIHSRKTAKQTFASRLGSVRGSRTDAMQNIGICTHWRPYFKNINVLWPALAKRLRTPDLNEPPLAKFWRDWKRLERIFLRFKRTLRDSVRNPEKVSTVSRSSIRDPAAGSRAATARAWLTLPLRWRRIRTQRKRRKVSKVTQGRK